jgi:hypothetical protein
MPEPITRTANQGDVGRSCPYCRFPLKSGAEVVQCGTCSAVHHDDCWVEGEGCAVVGCASGPRSGGARGPLPTPPTAAGTSGDGSEDPTTAHPGAGGPGSAVPADDPTAVHPGAGSAEGGSWPAPPPQGAPLGGPPANAWSQTPPPSTPTSGGSRRGLVAAVLVLALAIVGGAAAIVLSQDDGDPTTSTEAAVTAGPKPDTPTTTRGGTTTSGTSTTDGTTTDAGPTTTTSTGGTSTTGGPTTTEDDPPTTEQTPPEPSRPPNGQQRTTSSTNEGLLGAEHQTWRTETNTGAMEQTLRRHWQARADNDYYKAHGFLTGSALRKAGPASRWVPIATQDGLRRVKFDRVTRLSAGPSSGRIGVGLRTLDKDGCWRFDFVYTLVRVYGKWRISYADPLHARRASYNC